MDRHSSLFYISAMDEEEQFHNIDTRKPWKSTGKFIENLLKSNREVVPKIGQLKLIVRTFIKKNLI
jgi:hypothetical protein